MIISAGKRRLVSDRYNWKIEILHTKKNGEKIWKEDSPAYPATLARACELLAERELKDMPDISIEQLEPALKQSVHLVRKYMELARAAA